MNTNVTSSSAINCLAASCEAFPLTSLPNSSVGKPSVHKIATRRTPGRLFSGVNIEVLTKSIALSVFVLPKTGTRFETLVLNNEKVSEIG
jgi:hypothetical protein